MTSGIYDLSKTAASNTDIGGIAITVGAMAPSAVGPALRALAAMLKKWQEDFGGALTTTGSADAYLLDVNSNPYAGALTFADGDTFSFIANFTNAGPATLNVESEGAKAIRKLNDQALAAGDIVSGSVYTVHYDASANTAAGAWLIDNAIGNFQPLDAELTSWAAITRAAGFDTFVATPSSANLRTLLTDEGGTGAAYFVGGALGTPASGTATNLTGLPVSTGISGLGAGVATWAATPSTANLLAAISDEGGAGTFLGSSGWSTPAGAGDVVGPASVTDGRFALFDGTTGKLIKQHTGVPGTAAVANTGTAGTNIPFLDGANTWSGKQIINTAADSTGTVYVVSVSGSSSDYIFAAYRDSPVSASLMSFGVTRGGGITAGNPTGGAKGEGTINATGIYENGVQHTSGTYTPTLTAVTNVASATGGTGMYIRIGNVVSVTGSLTLDPTAGSTATIIGVSLPIASNFTLASDLFGMPSGFHIDWASATTTVGVLADPTSDRAEIRFQNVATHTSQPFYFHFQYIIK